MKRVVFAGRFDPVQEDHLEAARRSAAAAGLEEVLFLLLPDSPDQPCHAPFEDRYRMLELACKGQPGFSCGVRGQTGDELSENLCPEGVDEGTPPDRIRSMIADGYLYRIPDPVAIHILELGLYGIGSKGVPRLETGRLVLRGIRPNDREFLVALDTDPRVMRHVHDGAMSRQEAEEWASCQTLQAHSRSRHGRWIVERRADGARLGWVELAKHGGWRRDDLQVGYQFATEFHGHGYGREAVKRVTRYAFEQLELDRVVAIVRPANHRSAHLLEGLRFRKVKRPPRERFDQHDFYVVKRREFFGFRHSWSISSTI